MEAEELPGVVRLEQNSETQQKQPGDGPARKIRVKAKVHSRH